MSNERFGTIESIGLAKENRDSISGAIDIKSDSTKYIHQHLENSPRQERRSIMLEVHEEGTGAVRSLDLATERWDLISGSAVDCLQCEMNFIRYETPAILLVNLAIIDAWSFLGHTTHTTGMRYQFLIEGWANLATAIQQIDQPAREAANLRTMYLQATGNPQHYPYYALKRLAQTCHEGAVKYGEHNWLNGFQVSGLLNHAIRHMILYTNGNTSEDHLGHSMWGFMASIHMHLYRPDMCTGLLGPNYTLTDAIKAKFPFKNREAMT